MSLTVRHLARCPVRSIYLATAIWLAFGAVGCAGGGSLAGYPLRQVDRPLTLPDSVRAWVPTFTMSHTDPDRKWTVPGLLDPFRWLYSPADNIDVAFTPIPSAVIVQLYHARSLSAGVSVGIEQLEFSSGDGFTDVAAGVEWQLRYRLLHPVAFELGAKVVHTSRPASVRENAVWSSGALFGVAFQMTDEVCMEVAAARSGAEHPIDSLPYAGYFEDSGRHRDAVAWPIRGTLGLSASHRWDVELFYQYLGVGYTDRYRAHVFGVALTNYQ